MNKKRKPRKNPNYGLDPIMGLSLEDRVYECIHRESCGMPAGFALKIWYGEQNLNGYQCRVLVLEKLGNTLGNIQRSMYRNRISPGNIMHIAGIFDSHTVRVITVDLDQLIHRLEILHDTGFIHRDIKPDNIMVGLGRSSLIHLADFGMAKVYRDKKRNHFEKLTEMGFVGTQLFASPNAHANITQSRRDDLISLGYTIIYLDWFSKVYKLTNPNLAQEKS